MARLPACDLRRIVELEAELRTVVDGAPSALQTMIPEIRGLLGVDNAIAHVFAPRGDGLRLEQAFSIGLPPGWPKRFDTWLADKAVSWTNFNPIRPEPRQRNVALSQTELRAITGKDPHEAPVEKLLARIGYGGHDNLRVLVCDGPSLLAWVGAFQSTSFDARQRRTLQRMVPALRRRLVSERLLTEGPALRAMFDAAFAAIPTAAFIVDPRGTILEANHAGRAWLARDLAEVRAAVRDAVLGKTRAPRFTVTRVAARGVPERSLAVLRAGAAPPGVHAASVAARWSLTPRQSEVLALLVDGLSTRTIAAMLRVAERTVEAHLGAMFEKAQVSTRAELVARVWSR